MESKILAEREELEREKEYYFLEQMREEKSHKASYIDAVNLLLTAIVAASACISSYFSYQAVQTASDSIELLKTQESREEREEFRETLETTVKLAAILRDLNNSATERQSTSSENQE